MIQYISHSFKYFQDGEIDLKLLTNVLSPETEVFEVTIIYVLCLSNVCLIKVSHIKSGNTQTDVYIAQSDYHPGTCQLSARLHCQ